jgi:hypothetical protein
MRAERLYANRAQDRGPLLLARAATPPFGDRRGRHDDWAACSMGGEDLAGRVAAAVEADQHAGVER